MNNAAEQHPQDTIEKISADQLERTFRTNVFSMFHCVRAALPHLRAGARIINTTSVTAYRGSPHLLDYSATKGAIVAFTRSLALSLANATSASTRSRRARSGRRLFLPRSTGRGRDLRFGHADGPAGAAG